MKFVKRDGKYYGKVIGGSTNPDFDALEVIGKNSVVIAVYGYNSDFVAFSNLNIFTLENGIYTPISKNSVSDIFNDYVENEVIKPRKSSAKFITDNDNPVTVNAYGGTWNRGYSIKALIDGSGGGYNIFCSAPQYNMPGFTQHTAQQFPFLGEKNTNMLIEYSFEKPIKNIHKVEWTGWSAFSGRYATDFEIFVDRKSVFKGTEERSTGNIQQGIGKNLYSYEW